MNIVNTFLNPQSIAVIGASRNSEKVGYQVLKNIIDSGYKKPLYPVNPSGESILSLKTHISIESIPHPLDMAVIVTPAPTVLGIIQTLITSNCKSAVIITAGFAETSPQGKELQDQIKNVVKNSPLRIIGPNCLGCFSTINNLNATFGPKPPNKGKIMLVSQSGAIVTGVLDWLNHHQLGLSHGLTFGNRLDVGENEALAFAASDPNTDIILTYLESFQNAPEFFSLASRITPYKPIILLKGGQSAEGQKASASHTAALASDYVLIKAFAKQTGVILTDTIDHWLKTASAFAQVKPIKSTAVSIITNAGGPGVLASDLVSQAKLKLPQPSESTINEIYQKLPGVAPHNPLDVLGDATPEKFTTALSILDKDPHTSCLLTILTPQTMTDPTRTATLISETAKHLKRPLFIVYLGGEKLREGRQLLYSSHIPTYTYPTEAIETISSLAHYQDHRQDIYLYPGQKPHIISHQKKLRLDREFALPLSLKTSLDLISTYKLNVPRSRIIHHQDEIPHALNFTGKPAVLKTADMKLAHKAALGGVKLNIMTVAHARLAFRALEKLSAQILVQQTIHGHVELIIGAKRDPQLGPFITMGLGGALTNTLEDRAYAFIPTSNRYLNKVFNQTKASKALNHLELPQEPIIDALVKISAIMLDFPQISEMEINPAILTDKKLFCCDIKITLS